MNFPKLYTAVSIVLFVLFLLPQNAAAICLPTTVSTWSNDVETTVCPSDGEADFVRFKPNSWATDYHFIVTNEEDIIVATFSQNKFDFENLGGGVSKVYGLSYSGFLSIPIGVNINEADIEAFCWILSDNFVTVNRVIPDGGDVVTTNGDTITYACPDGNPDVLSFSNMNTSIGNYAYLIANANDTIIGISQDGNFDFEGLPEGSCFVYGVAYAGDLTAEIGDDINNTDLSDSCFDLSETAVEVFKDVPEGGIISFADASDFIEICVGDGQPSIVSYTQTNPSNSLYGYLITDENDNLLAIETNDSYDFEGAGAGICRIYGFAYTGNIQSNNGANIFNIDLSDDCFSITTNFITVNKLKVDGGSITSLSGFNLFYVCPGDGNDDVIQFQSIGSNTANYDYLVTDTLGNILDFTTDNSYDFNDAGEGICRIYGVSYFENFNENATNIFTDVLADDCYEISNNFVQVIRAIPDAGDILFSNGDTIMYTCPGDGSPDVVEFAVSNNSNSLITYAITNEMNQVLAVTDDGTWDFDEAPAGTCRIYSVAYTGTLFLSAMDSLLFNPLISSDCFDVSEQYIEVIRETPNGGLIELDNGQTEIYTCPNNGSADIVAFNHTDASNSPYAYLILDENNLVVAVETGDSYDFENAPLGNCFVLGVAYTGNIIIQAGEDASTADFSDDCFAFSDNLITVRRVNPDAGTVEFINGMPTTSICVGDGNDDVLAIQNVDASNAPFQFIITDSSDVILGTTFAFNINFDIYGADACRVYGLSYTGDYIGMIGDTLLTIDLSTDCFDLSDNFLSIGKTYVNAGNLTTTDGESTLVICPNDGIPNVVAFTTDSDASDSDYQYVITNNQGIILAVPTDNTFDFEPAGIGICKVYGVSYTGNLTAAIDSSITTVFSDECYVVSDNFVEILRDEPNGDIIVSSLGDDVNFCVNDGQEDVVSFITGSFSFANYAYIITDENGIVIGTEMNDFHDFDDAPPGVCRVYGISYTGHLIAGEGDDIQVDPLSDDCFDLSDNFITITRILVDGATIFTPGNTTDEVYVCPGDGNADFVGLFNTSTIDEDYKYVITTDSNTVIDVISFNLYDFENLPEGICRIYGLSHTGTIDVDAGDDLFTTALTDGCYDISDNFITVIKVNPVGGTVTSNGETEAFIFLDDEPDTLYFENTGSPLAKQRYVVTDENDVILDITADNFVDFESDSIGNQRVYNLAFTGNLQAQVGEVFLAMPPASGCWAVSDNFVLVFRIAQFPDFTKNRNNLTTTTFDGNIEVYPNPASDFIKIKITSEIENPGQLQIVDLSGKIIYSMKHNFEIGQNSFEIPVNHWENGLYLLTVQNDKSIFHEKFVKD